MKSVLGLDKALWGGGLKSPICGNAIFLAGVLAVWLAGSCLASGQVVPAGDAGGSSLTVGATATGFQLGYGDRKMLGIAAVADLDTKRRTGFEGEAQWLIFNQTANVHT